MGKPAQFMFYCRFWDQKLYQFHFYCIGFRLFRINQERKGGKVKNDNHNLKPIFFTKFRVVFNKIMKKS